MNRVILLTAILVAITFNAYATNYYVDKTASGASDSNNGLASISGGVPMEAALSVGTMRLASPLSTLPEPIS